MPASADEQKTISTLCVEILSDCLEQLEGPDSLEDEELVHTLRVATKRLRSAWHLVDDLSGSKVSRKRRKALRKLSGNLSFRRDLAVLEELTGNLAETVSDPESALLLGDIRDSIGRRPSDSMSQPCRDGLFEEVRSCLEDEIAAWRGISWDDPPHARKAIRRRLHKTESRARRNTKKALKHHSADVWHEWRKAIKRLRYQREFVAEASGRQPGKFDARVSRLGTALGQMNDFANLSKYVESEVNSGGIKKGDQKKLHPVIGHAERDLIRNCRRLGRKLLRKS